MDRIQDLTTFSFFLQEHALRKLFCKINRQFIEIFIHNMSFI